MIKPEIEDIFKRHNIERYTLEESVDSEVPTIILRTEAEPSSEFFQELANYICEPWDFMWEPYQ